MTRSPTFQPVTSAPSAATSPATSMPMISGMLSLMPGMPRKVKRS